ncbi:probable cyclic nucleotide-gated ion channel 20, chloroplastic [Momordica charantia]|uniref:Probable cyclic nucleotide-gated ion channel 20, chloroplastic n=1 Tax=Momordica charantia TaxID=3673 RepID=A0A6J1C626_MOMCH|nr:probable cyclic nucleotide-gated ion channel 20, chloroplastic [Momordica charantia]XP_022137220.1 probable cyclic nucleotide-gated ion channel 20, chloroplastic [Momordica charantia]XP_022137221.1 probable cyclic nucleotide-gated ion channel 20, chloroplastic [Momordica charantia]
MAAFEKDDIPMLSNTDPPMLDEQVGSYFPSFASLTRSSSLSIPTTSSGLYGNEANLVGHTGPLRSDRKSSFMVSGSTYTGRKPERLSQSNPGVPESKTAEPLADKFPSFKAKDESDWSIHNYAGRNEHLIKSGQLGMCSDPFCITCPTYNLKASKHKSLRMSGIFDHKFQSDFFGDGKGWAGKFRTFWSFLLPYIPGVMNPHAKVVQQWNKFFVISCLVAIFLDPLFFFLLAVKEDKKCIVINWPLTTTLVAFRSLTDFIYLLNMLLQFRLAYVSPESLVVGAGELVDQPKEIALHYIKGKFFVDLLVVLPLPQIIVFLVLPKSLGSSGANYAKNLLRNAVTVQYIPRLYRFLPLLAGQSPSGFVFETAWANFVINLLTFMLAGHIVGSFWYLLGLQGVNRCFRDACNKTGSRDCLQYIDCGHGDEAWSPDHEPRRKWGENGNAKACFAKEDFDYGIYLQAVNLTTKNSIITRYTYSLFWGFQQISTLAGNQVPSYYEWEVLFTMGIIGLGLLLFALLIGNMQNFLQALGRRRLEMSLRRRDVEQWMEHRRLPENLRRQVRQAERYNWASTRGVNEERIFENLPEDLQRNIRRHLFRFVNKVRIFALMDYEPILDAIRERLRQKTYIEGSEVFSSGDIIEKMVFIVRGKMESRVDGIVVPLSEGDVCGEELLTWCLEHSSMNRDMKRLQVPAPRLVSNRTVRCLTNVEAFSLRAADLEEVTSMFSRFLRNPRVQGAIRYESPYWRYLATTRIQVAWRYRKKRLSRAQTSRSNN